uniref:hypothetical protein n=1 Tax=Enterococcus italicus TaxID=246144 RepID=UPI001CB9A320|nr:hypothetical protein [Enterococcus italicus]
MGLSSQTLGKKKRKTFVFPFLVFSKAAQSRKAPPVISSRPFHGEHFMQRLCRACQQDCLLGKSKRGTLDRYNYLIIKRKGYKC